MAHSPRGERADAGHLRRFAFATVTLLAALAAASGSADEVPRAGLTFERHSQLVGVRSLVWMKSIAEPSVVRVHEPYESREVRFEALPLARVLDAVYGSSWREEEELLFTCKDGYQPTVPVARVLAHRAWLAFDRPDQSEFAIRKREAGEFKEVELGPYYLIWENLDDPRIRQEADYGWPYQVVGIDLIRRRARFPRMAPPPGSSVEVRAGFAAFRVHCSKCHKLKGEGGSIGPELNAASRPVEYRDTDWLRAWIENPGRIRPGTRMPALNPALPDRARTVDEIIAYLRAMSDTPVDADAP